MKAKRFAPGTSAPLNFQVSWSK